MDTDCSCLTGGSKVCHGSQPMSTTAHQGVGGIQLDTVLDTSFLICAGHWGLSGRGGPIVRPTAQRCANNGLCTQPDQQLSFAAQVLDHASGLNSLTCGLAANGVSVVVFNTFMRAAFKAVRDSSYSGPSKVSSVNQGVGLGV